MGISLSTLYRFIRWGRRLRLKPLWVALLLAGGLLAPLAHETPALAILCRSDPILVVNGAIIDVTSTLWTTPDNINEIDYQVTVPSGALLGGVTLTLGLGFPENITYVFSPTQPKGSVQVAASVILPDGTSSFPLAVQVKSLLAGSATASGTSDTTTTVSLDHILML